MLPVSTSRLAVQLNTEVEVARICRDSSVQLGGGQSCLKNLQREYFNESRNVSGVQGPTVRWRLGPEVKGGKPNLCFPYKISITAGIELRF